jgi:hypothetical protein
MSGIAAAAAAWNGVSASAAAKARAMSAVTESTRPIAANSTAADRSETIITRRRSNRSAIAPAIGPASPTVPKVSSNVADTHAADRVRS